MNSEWVNERWKREGRISSRLDWSSCVRHPAAKHHQHCEPALQFSAQERVRREERISLLYWSQTYFITQLKQEQRRRQRTRERAETNPLTSWKLRKLYSSSRAQRSTFLKETVCDFLSSTALSLLFLNLSFLFFWGIFPRIMLFPSASPLFIVSFLCAVFFLSVTATQWVPLLIPLQWSSCENLPTKKSKNVFTLIGLCCCCSFFFCFFCRNR